MQLKRLDTFIKRRRENFRELIKFFSGYPDFFALPRQLENVETAWLAFPLTINSSAPFERIDLVTFLERNGIQTRPLFAGNILRQPGFKGMSQSDFKNNFPNADNVMKNSFLVGCNNGLTKSQIEYMKNIFRKLLDKF